MYCSLAQKLVIITFFLPQVILNNKINKICIPCLYALYLLLSPPNLPQLSPHIPMQTNTALPELFCISSPMVLLPTGSGIRAHSLPGQCWAVGCCQTQQQERVFYSFPHSGIDRNVFTCIAAGFPQTCKSTTVPGYSYVQCFSNTVCTNQIQFNRSI